MSTLNSTNMSITRPTSRVLAPPGGGSSINIFGGGGGDDAPATKATKPAFNPSFEPSKPVVEETPVAQEPEPEPVVAAPVVTKPVVAAPSPEPVVTKEVATITSVTMPATAATGVIGMVAVNNGGEANAALKARTLAVLAARGVAQVAMAEVADAMLLPVAAKRMAASGKVGTVLAVAALTEEGCLGKEVAAAVAGGLVAASVATPGCNIVPGMVLAPTEAVAVAKAADAPLAWVTAAMGMAKQAEQEVAFTFVSTTAATPATEAAPAAPVPVCATPEKKMAEMSLSSGKAAATTPGGRVRGAGPSSIVFG